MSMKNLRGSLAAKLVAILLFLAVSVGGFWASILTISRWEDLWSGGDFYQSSLLENQLIYDAEAALELAALKQSMQWAGRLNYGDQQQLQMLEEALAPEGTNFRFQVHDQEGTLLCGNTVEGLLEASVNRTAMTTCVVRRLSSGKILTERMRTSYGMLYEAAGDSQAWDGRRGIYLLSVSVDGVLQVFTPDEREGALAYGWSYDGESWSYEIDRDSRVKSVELVLEYGVADPLVAEDAYTQIKAEFMEFQDNLPVLAVLAVALDLVAGALLVFLVRAAGRRAGEREVRLNWQDRIPYDLYLCLAFLLYALIISSGDSITYAFNRSGATLETLVGLAVISASFSGITLAAVLTTATRIKVGRLCYNSLVCAFGRWLRRGLRACGRWLKSLGRNWPLVWRVGGVFCLYLLVSVVSAPTVIFFLLWQGVVLWTILRWIKQWLIIRAGVGRIVGGEPDYRIDAGRMFPDLREHAVQLNDLGGAIGSAVEERLKSERFKAELITNVSHDLKTPLTSIINYVDLLKKEEIESPKAQEYLEVLDRKSQRLKKLTEDLVEASKASTGNLTVVKTRLGVCQLLEQAAAEYEEKLAQKGLSLVYTLPGEELYVEADGRHLWRILDNLLGNCYKYALEGTRIYLSVARRDGGVSVSMKNISRQQLNIPPEQLLERFVRGEESRSTEGSGLGLSIARSLTELQGGAFKLDIDGDLFKATVSFPEAPATELMPAERWEKIPLADQNQIGSDRFGVEFD